MPENNFNNGNETHLIQSAMHTAHTHSTRTEHFNELFKERNERKKTKHTKLLCSKKVWHKAL